MISARESIRILRDHARSARAADDPEGVHQVRVMAGRLSVWLEMAGRNMLRDDLAWLRRSASSLRDLDVIGERLESCERSSTDADGADGRTHRSFGRGGRGGKGAESALHDWRAQLRNGRESARRVVLAALSCERFSALLAALSCIPDVDEKTARASLPRFRARVERAGRALERAPEDLDALHRLRRAVRRMRYALEWVGDDAHALKELQEELGELNNWVMLLQHLEHAEQAEPVATDAGAHAINGTALPFAPHTDAPRESQARPIEPETAGGNDRARTALNGRAPLHRRVEIEIAHRRARFLVDWSRARPALARS